MRTLDRPRIIMGPGGRERYLVADVRDQTSWRNHIISKAGKLLWTWLQMQDGTIFVWDNKGRRTYMIRGNTTYSTLDEPDITSPEHFFWQPTIIANLNILPLLHEEGSRSITQLPTKTAGLRLSIR